MQSLDVRFGGGYVYKATDRRIQQVGVECLAIESSFDRSKVVRNHTYGTVHLGDHYYDEEHAWSAVQVRCAVCLPFVVCW